jgi:aminopeptidase N
MMDRTYDRPGEQFNWHRTYAKGAWIVHMLRSQLGDELYRECIKVYLQRNAFNSVVTENLNSVIEELTGRSFDRFFDQWVFHAGQPSLEIGYEWSQKDRLAKVSLKQTQELGDEVLIFHFPTKIRFIVDGESIDHEVFINSEHHDFYFPLGAEPNIVRFDPQYSVLAEISFEKPKKMLYAQLENTEDVIGRLMAIESLKKEKDKETVVKLRNCLQTDIFYEVRIASSDALREIHTNEAFEAIVDSVNQDDARVRRHVVEDIGGFYRPKSLEKLLEILKSEKNPDILYEVIRSLGRYHDEQVREVLVGQLESKSYRNRLAVGAIRAIELLKDDSYMGPLKEVLGRREREFHSYDFAEGLKVLGQIASEQEDKSEVRDFLAGYVNHKKKHIAMGAISALGELRDRGAITIVETFSGDDEEDPVQRSAKEALEKLRQQSKLVPEEIVELRKTVDQMKTDSDKLKEELEDIKKRLEAQGQAVQEPNEPGVEKPLDQTEPNQVE